MTQDWRKIERALADYFDTDGFSVTTRGDCIAELEDDDAISINLTKIAQLLVDLT